MEKNGISLWRNLNPEHLTLHLTQAPLPQSQGPQWSIEERRINDYDLFVCYSGEAIFTVNGHEYVLKEGSGLLIAPQDRFSARKISKADWQAIAQHFMLLLYNSVDYLSLISFKKWIAFPRWEATSQIFKRYADLHALGKDQLLQYTLCYHVIAEFISQAFTASKNPAHREWEFILKMVHFIDRHLSDRDVLKQAYALSAYSEDHTIRLFKQKIGLTPKQYLRKRQLRKGKDILAAGRSVKETAYLCGFKDELYFSRVFRKNEGMSPLEYKDQYGV